MDAVDPDVRAKELADVSLASGSPTAWFEELYLEAGRGDALIQWDRGTAHPLVVDWLAGHRDSGSGARAIVVGCGPGHDAELLAGNGATTTAFDVSATAVEQARARHPGSTVDYRTADLLELPDCWRGSFDLVVEVMTVQSVPRQVRAQAIAAISGLVAAGGTLLAVGAILAAGADPADGPPWPLDRDEIESFAAGRLTLVALDELPRPGQSEPVWWRAEFRG